MVNGSYIQSIYEKLDELVTGILNYFNNPNYVPIQNAIIITHYFNPNALSSYNHTLYSGEVNKRLIIESIRIQPIHHTDIRYISRINKMKEPIIRIKSNDLSIYENHYYYPIENGIEIKFDNPVKLEIGIGLDLEIQGEINMGNILISGYIEG